MKFGDIFIETEQEKKKIDEGEKETCERKQVRYVVLNEDRTKVREKQTYDPGKKHRWRSEDMLANSCIPNEARKGEKTL